MSNTEVLAKDDLELAVYYFSYADSMLLTDIEKAEYREHARKSLEITKYVQELRNILQADKRGADEAVASMVLECRSTLARASSIEAHRLALSKSWAWWDMAKQNYYCSHPSEAHKDYPVGPWQTKRQEIVDRHVGWEIYNLFGLRASKHKTQDPSLLFSKLIRVSGKQRIGELLQKKPNKYDSLRSIELAELGNLIRQ